MSFFATLFGCGKSDGRFVSENEFQKNLAKQVAMSPETLKRLRQYGMTQGTKLKLEYFFYTDAANKAFALAHALKQKDYTADHGPSAEGNKIFVITGWSTPMTMDEVTIVEWTRQMCQIGFEYDCYFDGWGTNPKQG